MCGIVGLISKQNRKIKEDIIRQMNSRIIHRGPDAGDLYVESGLGLGHRRLSILDLSENGNQPMFSYDGKYVIVFNGEIYNYLELKTELAAQGAVFRNTTDTEVILEAYRKWGTDCVSHFNGMWAFALYDREKKLLFLSRDRFGVKPLYIFENAEFFAFASEIKCITEIFPEEKQVDVVQVARHLQYVQEDADEHTFYKNIRNFPKNTNMLYCLETYTAKTHKYWDFDVKAFQEKWKTVNPYKTFRHLIEDAIKIRLRSDVPVGASLSGGLDSSTIVGIASKKYKADMNTFSAIYKEKNCDEKEFIDAVNVFAGTKDNPIFPDQAGNIIEDLKDLIYYHDGPCYTASPYSGYCVYRGVGDKVTVLLDGQGADELFGGYLGFYHQVLRDVLDRGTFFSRLKAVKLIAEFHAVWPDSMGILGEESLVEALGIRGYKNYIRKYRGENPREHFGRTDLFTEDFRKVDKSVEYEMAEALTTKLSQEMFLQLNYKMLPRILHDVDRNSMRNSLEVRLPFLDYRLVEFAFGLKSKYKIRGSFTKYIMRKSMKRYLPKKVRVRRNKMGFPAPFDKWLCDERYKEQIRNYIEAFKERGIVYPEILDRYYEEHIAGSHDRSFVLFNIMILEMWLQEEIDTDTEKWSFKGAAYVGKNSKNIKGA